MTNTIHNVPRELLERAWRALANSATGREIGAYLDADPCAPECTETCARASMCSTCSALLSAPVATQVVMPEPDMFWDAENPEDSFACGEREMFINLADNISMSDGKIIINLMRAARLPSIEASVWVTEDSEGEREVHFEYLNAADQAEGDQDE